MHPYPRLQALLMEQMPTLQLAPLFISPILLLANGAQLSLHLHCTGNSHCLEVGLRGLGSGVDAVWSESGYMGENLGEIGGLVPGRGRKVGEAETVEEELEDVGLASGEKAKNGLDEERLRTVTDLYFS